MKHQKFKDNAWNHVGHPPSHAFLDEIWYQMMAASVFLKAEAFSNYLLGVDPLAYTSKTSRFFEHPYGQVSVGFILTF